MAYFCENCGCKLTVNEGFCENCGHPVSVGPVKAERMTSLFPSLTPTDAEEVTIAASEDKLPSEQDVLYLFSSKDWDKRWKQAEKKCGAEKLGIVLINSCNYKYDKELGAFASALREYVSYRAKAGVYYYVLDISTEAVLNNRNPDCTHVVEVLKRVYRCAKPKYLLIVGDSRAVGATRWENDARDTDKFVDSDLPYLTLDMHSPWSGRQFCFEKYVRVGRIPARIESGYGEAVRYFSNAIALNINGAQGASHPFALSAQVWQKTSENVYRNMSGKVHSSPPRLVKDFSNGGLRAYTDGSDPNILYVNLHGSSQTNVWYGQDAHNNYPDAFSPNCLPAGLSGYMVGVEACYGAQPNSDNGVLKRALQNGCFSFLGSTQIAYGAVNGSMSCADVVVGEYIKYVASGHSAGDAFIIGLNKLAKGDMSDTTIKTLAEFALYGDPSAAFAFRRKEGEKSLPEEQAPKFDKGLHIPMPDVRNAVKLKLTEVNARIAETVTSFVNCNYGDFSHVVPEYCEVKGYGGYQAMYLKDDGNFQSVLKVYFDKNGTVKQVCVSK